MDIRWTGAPIYFDICEMDQYLLIISFHCCSYNDIYSEDIIFILIKREYSRIILINNYFAETQINQGNKYETDR